VEELTREKQVHLTRLLELIKDMPFYIEEFVDEKLISKSPSTLLAYVRDYQHFFQWAKAEGLIEYEKMQDIPLSFLENLRKKEVENYIRFLNARTKNNVKAINRKISALKSLFRYLTTQTEDENGECYFYRNVMSKIELLDDKQTEKNIAGSMADKILHNDEDIRLLHFIEHEYGNIVQGTKKERYFKRDRERDLAIIALFLSSGVRVSEAASLKISDIDLENRFLKVIRKGAKKDTITFKELAHPYLQNYKEIRKARYNAGDDEETFFLTLHKGKAHPMSVRAIQNLIEKYTKAYMDKEISPHKLRHTFATKLAENGVPLHIIQHQLGHSNPKTTSIYMNSTLKEMKKYIDTV
jgi:site-specific recombinase XerD